VEVTHRALTALVCCGLGLIVGAGGLALFQDRVSRSDFEIPDGASRDEIRMRRSMTPHSADAVAIRTMELLKARERIAALEAANDARGRSAAQSTAALASFRDEADRLRSERDDAFDMLLAVLSESPGPEGVAPVEGPARSESPTEPVMADSDPGELPELERAFAVESLRRELRDTQAALDAAQAQQAIALAALRDGWQASEAAALRAVRTAGTAAVPTLINQLENEDPSVRRWAARALRTLGADAIDAVPSLKLARSDSDELVRFEVEAALVAIRE